MRVERESEARRCAVLVAHLGEQGVGEAAEAAVRLEETVEALRRVTFLEEPWVGLGLGLRLGLGLGLGIGLGLGLGIGLGLGLANPNLRTRSIRAELSSRSTCR